MGTTDLGRAARWCALTTAVCALLATTSIAEASEDDKTAMLDAARRSVPGGDGDRTLAPYFFVWGQADGVDAMPLKSSAALVDVTGVIAKVSLEQVYRNDGAVPLEAVYLFPASTRAAIHAMKMTVGSRVIEARIEKREDARQRYERAKEEGQTASLLEQQRPNVFEMSVANILPGDEIAVELSYTELLVPEEGTYELVLPAVVGPRYSNEPAATAGPDAAWVEAPYLEDGAAPPFEHDIDVHVSSPIPIATVSSPSHEITLAEESDREINASLARPATAGDRDFVLRYSLAGDRIQGGVMVHDGADGRYFLAMIEPPDRVAPEDVLQREYLFVLDVSGSMAGFPLDVSKELMRSILDGLGPRDRFNILTFAGGSDVYSERPVRASAEAVADAIEWLDGLVGSGGTELLPALRRAFAMPRQADTARTVVVATDGYVTVEKEAFDLVSRKLGEANLFAFGIGSSVNRELIESLARAGRGEPFVVLDQTEAPSLALRFERYVNQPLLTDITVEGRGVELESLEPARIPDLFAARPIVVSGKLAGKSRGRIAIAGTGGAGPWERVVEIPSAKDGANAGREIGLLWARSRIARLSDREALGVSAKRDITALGLRFSLMTAYTSFVAVDEATRADGREAKTVKQPLPLPKGVPNSAVGGGRRNASASQGIGTSFGYGGMAVSGTGMGGGGVGYGTIGLGSLRTIGHGSGGGAGSGYGRGSGGAGVRGSASPACRVSAGKAIVRGSLSKEVIKRVIRTRINQIRHCYEQALRLEPGLEGKVVVRFVIEASGKVTGATVVGSTFDDDSIDRCILEAIEQLTFPAVADGGVNVVTYPFVLAPKH